MSTHRCRIYIIEHPSLSQPHLLVGHELNGPDVGCEGLLREALLVWVRGYKRGCFLAYRTSHPHLHVIRNKEATMKEAFSDRIKKHTEMLYRNGGGYETSRAPLDLGGLH